MATSKENTGEDLKETNNHLLDKVKLKVILEYDKLIQHLFEDTFYNFGSEEHVNDGININLRGKTEGGILYHFMKNLKMIKAYSAITNSLPCIITGSVVEGASLARLHHQDLADDTFEIEADIMYVVGSIKEEFEHSIIEPLLNNPGFLLLKYTPDILHFTAIPKKEFQNKYCECKQISEEVKYINGQKLKVILKDLQPSSKSYQRIAFHPFPSEINIEQNMNGPSAEIVLTTRFLHGKDDKKMFVLLLEKILERLKELFQFYVDALEWFCAVEKTANSYADALFKWINENEKHVSEVSEDLDDMAFQIFKCMLVYRERSLKFKRTYHNLIQFLSYLNYVMLDQPSYNFDSLKHELNCNNLWNILNGDYSKYKKTFENATPGNIYEKLKKIQEYHLNLNFYHSLKEETYIPLMDNYHLLHGLITSKIDQVKNNVFQINPEYISNNHIVSFDNVFCFYCYFWPKAANEWCTRKRLWPSTTTISKIKEAGCHIVSKSNPDSNEELDWRWSFSSAEIKLAKERSPAQCYCYFIFKSLFYKYLKFQIKEKSLPSYIAKTCMFYVSELHEEDWWSGSLNDMSTVAVCILGLFQYLECGLQKGFLAHYFINEINLLAGFSKQHIEKALDLTRNILTDPKKYLKLSSSVLQKIDSISKDIQTHVRNSEGVIMKGAYSNTLEHIKIANNIKLNEEFTYTNAWNYRALYLIECSQIQIRKYMFIKTLEMFSRLEILSRTKAQKHIAIAKTQKLVTDLEIQFTNTYHNTKLALKQMASLLKLHCKRCDICLQEITCQVLRYCCREGCDYDECEVCYTKEKGNVNDTVTKKGVEGNENGATMEGVKDNHVHAHPLIKTHECSNYCFMFTEGYFKEEQVMKTYQFYMKQYSSFNKPLLDLSSRIGHNDRTRCERLEDPGEIMKELMQETFKESNAHKAVKVDEDKMLESAKTEASVELKETFRETENEDGIIKQMRDETDKKTDVKDTAVHKAEDVEGVKDIDNLQEKNVTVSKSINNNSVFNHLLNIKTFFHKKCSAVKKTVIRKEMKVEHVNTVATGYEDKTANSKDDFIKIIKNFKDITTKMMVLMIDITFEGNNIFNDGDKVINNTEEAVNNEHQDVNNGDKVIDNAEEAVNKGYKVSNDGDKATNNVDKISLLKDDGQFLREYKDTEILVTGINRLKFMEEYLFQT